MVELAGKTVLITGAAGGFGRELTRQLLQAGSFLLLSDRALPAIHAAVAEAARTLGPAPVRGRVLGYIAADLASREGCEQLHRQAVALAPQIDILINNAGIGVVGPFTAIPADVWERLMAVNLLAPMRLTALFLPAMEARRSGWIVNISSVAGLIGTAGGAPYATSKFGLRGFSESLADELPEHGIGVTTIYPFYTRTPILDSARFGPGAPTPLPPWLVGDPAAVVAEMLAGIRAGKATVLPGFMAKQMALLQRLAPGAPHALNRFVSSLIAAQAQRNAAPMEAADVVPITAALHSEL